MSRKKAFHTKPCLQPSTTLHSLNLPTIAATFFLLALLLATTLSSQQFINFIVLHSHSTSASSTVIGILVLIFYFLLYCTCLYHVARPNDLFVLVRTTLGYRRRYHRSHVYHMRIDRLRKIMKTQGFRIPQIFELPRHAPPPRSASHLYDLADFVLSHPNLADSNNHLWLALRTFLEHGSLPPRHGGGIGRAQAEPEATAPSAWLDRVETLDNTGLVDECRELLARLPAENKKFKLSVPGVSLYPRELVAFLGDTWLDDSAIYAGCRFVRYNASDPTIAFADTFHVPLLKKERESSPTYTPRHTELDESLLPDADQPVTRVFLPLHVHGAHWTLFHLDLEAGTYSYADCLWQDETPPLEDLETIFWWLNGLGIDVPSLRRVPFESLLRTAFGDDSDIVLPVQKDSSSCGVIVLNLMAALLLNYDIWSQDRAAHERLMWFIRLAQDPPTYESDVDSDVDSDDEDGPSDDTGDDSTEGDSDWVQVSQPHSPTSRNAVSASSTLPSSSMPSIPSSPTGSSFPNNSSTLGKRRRKVAVSLPPFSRPQLFLSDDSEFSDSGESRYLKRRRRHVGPRAGTSWARQKDLKARAKDKEFKAHRMKLDNFKSKIRAIDSHAEFQAEDPIAVRCSACTQWIFMRALYDTLRFSEHRGSRKCRGLQATGMVSKSLWSMGFVYKKSVRPTATCMVPVPCPGLTRQSDPQIDNYLARTSVPNGGAPSRTALARNLFGVDAQWSGLTKKQRRMVLRREKSLAVWRNMHDIEAVFSTVCTTTVYCGSDCDPPPCEACDALYKLHTFQVAIRRPLPKEANMKFTPKAYRCSQLGEIYLKYTGVRELMEKDDGKSPWLKFAVGVVEGKYDSDVLLGMVEAFVAKADRLEQGKSLRNMKYSSAFSDFCDVIACLSPVTYRTFQEHFGGRSMESMRRIRARGPRFQPGFSPENVAAVADLLEKYDYNGPLSLSWDDTELAPAVSIYQESKDVCVIIGGGDDVVRVGPGDNIDAVLSNAELTKATKLRIWLLTIPIPKIPPILIAAVARGASSSAIELKQMHDRVAQLLHRHDIYPISGASDGTETERSLQSMILRSAPSSKTFTIPNSHLSAANISLTIPFIDGRHPFVAVQDSKHALKTARNQILTGARLLTIGNDVLHYQQLLESAYAGSPLLTADVGSGLDRQDDRAAARVFSAKMLEYNLTNNPQQRALSIYLFVLGELVDAWQNRQISHRVRAKMVMRARFFLTTWRSHIDAHPQHSVHVHFISRESFDIFITLCDSLLALMIVHRVHHPKCPFCPWLHSTEPCEHVFGVIRKIKPDFTYADMLAVERKLAVLISGAFKNLTPEQKASATSAGYHHTYFDCHGLDLHELAQLPTDLELAHASDAAFDEASQLLSYLNISATKFLAKYVAPPSQQRPAAAPSPQQTIASLLSLYDNTWRGKDIAKCELAIAAESAAKSQEIDELPEMLPEDVEAIKGLLSSMCLDIVLSTTAANAVNLFSTVCLVDDSNTLQIDAVVAERAQHETEFARRAVRKTANAPIIMEMNVRTLARAFTEGLTLREQLTSKLKEIEVEVVTEARRTGGVGRQIRHTGTFAGHLTTTQAETKATVKGAAATKFLQLRDKALAPLRGYAHENLPTANISPINPLSQGQLVIALFPSLEKGGVTEVFLGEVVTSYSKGNGKNAKHDWATGIENLGVASYIYVRKFVPLAGDSVFTALSCPDLSTVTFVQVPRTHLLLSLGTFTISRGQSVSVNGFDYGVLNLCATSTALFTTLRNRRGLLSECIRVLKALLAGKEVGPTACVTEVADEAESECDD